MKQIKKLKEQKIKRVFNSVILVCIQSYTVTTHATFSKTFALTLKNFWIRA